MKLEQLQNIWILKKVYMDIKESDGLISMAYLYQDKELIERHGIGVIIGKQYYRIGIAPEIGTTLNKNSKIIALFK